MQGLEHIGPDCGVAGFVLIEHGDFDFEQEANALHGGESLLRWIGGVEARADGVMIWEGR
jgi:hypothetical protein